MTRSFSLIVLLAILLGATPVLADDIRPAYLSLTETAPGQFDVLFKVPRRGGTVLALRAVLPDPFRRITEPEVELTGDAQLISYTVQADPWELDGTKITIDGLAATVVDALVRVQFADGAVVTRVLRPEAPTCVMPLPRRGSGAMAKAFSPAAVARDTVLAGIRHVLTSLPHLLLVLAVALLGRVRSAVLAAGVFFAGQVVGSLVGGGFDLCVPLPFAEALLAATAAVIAAQRTTGRGLLAVIALTGAIHGSALASGKPVLAALGLALGIDCAQLVIGGAGFMVVSLILRPDWIRGTLRYTTGATAVFLTALLATGITPRDATVRAPLVSLAIATPSDGPASTALAPATDAPVRVFAQVEPFETRVEAVLKLTSLEPDADLPDVLPIDRQEEFLNRVGEDLARITTVTVDGRNQVPAFRRIDFVTKGDTGVLERPDPIPEPIAEAWIGIVWSFPTDGMPNEVQVHWGVYPDGGAVPAVLVDPEATRARELSPDRPILVWKNELRNNPVPTIDAVAVLGGEAGLSIISLLLLAGAAATVFVLARRGSLPEGLTLLRLCLAGACLVAPIATIGIPLPAGAAPEEREAAGIVEALLTNVHRAFDHPEEEGVYGRLMVSVTGDQLTSIYLEHRKTLELARRGGARARADSVEVEEVREVRPLGDGGFSAETEWQVSGFVVHFGHRHFRRNRYRARVTVVSENDAWRIREIDVMEKQRVR